MSLPDRILPLCDLLLGAAYADKQFQDREREVVQELLAELTGAPATKEIEERIAAFEPSRFDLAATGAEFRGDPEEDRRRILHLVVAVHDADDELDFAEDEYLRALAGALDLPASALAGLTLDVEIEEMRDHLEKVRKPPPPPPARRSADSADVDVE